MNNIIEIENLTKSFGDVKAVRNISFSVHEGELFAFLGENGAGKSTTISIICGVLGRDGGSVRVLSRDIDKDMKHIKNNIGVVFQNSVLDKALSVRDNLRSRAAFYGICGSDFEARLKELTSLLELEGLLGRTLGKLSGGQRRRIDIARALINKPKLLILDEPTTGLDPQTRKTVWETVTGLRKRENMTVFLTTHYMEEAADADRAIILEMGVVAAEGTPHQLKEKYAGDYIMLYEAEEKAVAELGLPYERVGAAIRIKVSSSREAARLIAEKPQLFGDFEVIKGKMDDVFLAVTGRARLSGGDDK